MKKLAAAVVILCGLLVFSAVCHAYSITIKNDTDMNVEFQIFVEVFTGQDSDGTIAVSKHSQAVYYVKAAVLCPSSVAVIKLDDQAPLNEFRTARGAKCWNTTYRLYKEGVYLKYDWN